MNKRAHNTTGAVFINAGDEEDETTGSQSIVRRGAWRTLRRRRGATRHNENQKSKKSDKVAKQRHFSSRYVPGEGGGVCGVAILRRGMYSVLFI